MQSKIGSEVSQAQGLRRRRKKRRKSTHSLMPHLCSQDGRSLVGLRYPDLSAFSTGPQKAPAKWLEHFFKTSTSQVSGIQQCLSAGREDKEWLEGNDTDRQGGGQSRSSGTAGHFLGIVTKAHDCGEEDTQGLAGAAGSHWGLGLYLSASPPSPQT